MLVSCPNHYLPPFFMTEVLRRSMALKLILRDVSKMIPRREGGRADLLPSTSDINKGHIAIHDEMTVLNPMEISFVHDCKHGDSTQYLEPSTNIC